MAAKMNHPQQRLVKIIFSTLITVAVLYSPPSGQLWPEEQIEILIQILQ